MSLTAFAGQWKSDNKGYWYQNNDNSYPVLSWQEIDGKWYYFGSDGYMAASQWVGNYYVGSDGAMLINTTTPDGYQVNATGAWVENGTVKTRNVRATGQTTYTKSNSKSEEKKSNSNSNNSNRQNSSDTRGETKKKEKKSQYLLYDEKYSYIGGFYTGKEKTKQVTDGATWTDTIVLGIGGMMEFSNEAGYTRLRATVAPGFDSSISKEKKGEFIVYGDAGVVLYESGEVVAGETEPFDIEVDISGQSKVQLACSTAHDWFDIAVKSARFED